LWTKKEEDEWGEEGGLQPPPAHPSEMALAVAAGVLNRRIICVVFYIPGNMENWAIFENARISNRINHLHFCTNLFVNWSTFRLQKGPAQPRGQMQWKAKPPTWRRMPLEDGSSSKRQRASVKFSETLFWGFFKAMDFLSRLANLFTRHFRTRHRENCIGSNAYISGLRLIQQAKTEPKSEPMSIPGKMSRTPPNPVIQYTMSFFRCRLIRKFRHKDILSRSLILRPHLLLALFLTILAWICIGRTSFNWLITNNASPSVGTNAFKFLYCWTFIFLKQRCPWINKNQLVIICT
jgi:hypothetical protein